LLAGSSALATEDRLVLIEKGKPAPFAGTLYATERAIRVTKKAERCEFILTEEKQKGERVVEHQKMLCADRVKNNDEAHELAEQTLKDRPAEWWQIGLAYLAGIGTMALTFWAVGQANK
jgi:hypothetical protein